MKTTNLINKLYTDRVSLLIALTVIILYFIPFIIFGENSYLTIHDNLDSNVVWMKLSLNNQAELMLNGNIQNSSISGNYDFSQLIFKLFGIYWGYIVNKILMAFVAFFGMRLLLQFLFKNYKASIINYTSLIFALLPFWSFSLNISFLPIAIFAFLSIRIGNYKYTNWIILICYAFCSSLILVGFFLLIIMSILFAIDFISGKRNFQFLMAIILLSIFYIISHFPIIYSSFFIPELTSHRVEFKQAPYSFLSALKKSIIIFLKGQYHSPSIHTILLIPIIISFAMQIKIKQTNKYGKYILIFIISTSLYYGFNNFIYLQPFTQKMNQIIPIQLQRFHFLQSVCWIILFFISIKEIIMKNKYGKHFFMSIILIQIYILFLNNEFLVGWKNNNPTYTQFYKEKIFSDINKDLNLIENKNPVLCVGFHPGIAQFNNIKTMGAYCASYPLEYKHEFRKIIKEELKKDIALSNYYDNWGSRCYAFSSELGQNINMPLASKIENLDFNYKLLKKMNCLYILSTVSININKNKQIELYKEYKHETNSIFVYTIL